MAPYSGEEPAANRLEDIVGHWRTDGHVIAEEPIPVQGSDVYELLAGGHFLIHHVDVTVGEQPVKAIEIIGEQDDETGALIARSYGDDGAMTLMRVRVLDDGVWHFTGGGEVAPSARVDAEAAESPAVRSTLRVSADRHTMTALWERTEDGESWLPWMDIRFTRAD